MTEFSRISAVVADIEYPGYAFDVHVLGNKPEYYAISVRYLEPDVYTGVAELQRGRLWPFLAGQADGQIIQTCFKAILTSLEHRAREHFKWRGRPVLMPHQDLQKVWEDAVMKMLRPFCLLVFALLAGCGDGTRESNAARVYKIELIQAGVAVRTWTATHVRYHPWGGITFSTWHPEADRVHVIGTVVISELPAKK